MFWSRCLVTTSISINSNPPLPRRRKTEVPSPLSPPVLNLIILFSKRDRWHTSKLLELVDRPQSWCTRTISSRSKGDHEPVQSQHYVAPPSHSPEPIVVFCKNHSTSHSRCVCHHPIIVMGDVGWWRRWWVMAKWSCSRIRLWIVYNWKQNAASFPSLGWSLHGWLLYSGWYDIADDESDNMLLVEFFACNPLEAMWVTFRCPIFAQYRIGKFCHVNRWGSNTYWRKNR